MHVIYIYMCVCSTKVFHSLLVAKDVSKLVSELVCARQPIWVALLDSGVDGLGTLQGDLVRE
jgi:hypothetical protein